MYYDEHHEEEIFYCLELEYPVFWVKKKKNISEQKMFLFLIAVSYIDLNRLSYSIRVFWMITYFFWCFLFSFVFLFKSKSMIIDETKEKYFLVRNKRLEN